MRKVSPLKVSKRNIENFKRAKLSYVIDDLVSLGVSPQKAAKILMARGVVRNFNIRRSVLSYNSKLKSDLRLGYGLIENKMIPRPWKGSVPVNVSSYYRHIGRLETLRQVKRDLENLVAARGYVLPKGDRRFNRLLECSSRVLINA